MSCSKHLGLPEFAHGSREKSFLVLDSNFCLNLLMCSEFGAKVVPPKKILKMLPELFDHQDQNVRASSKGLTLELCRWIGKDAVKSILFDKMRDTMVRSLRNTISRIS